MTSKKYITQEWYLIAYPEYNESCVVCGKTFNRLYLCRTFGGPTKRVVCSDSCREVYEANHHSGSIKKKKTRRKALGNRSW